MADDSKVKSSTPSEAVRSIIGGVASSGAYAVWFYAFDGRRDHNGSDIWAAVAFVTVVAVIVSAGIYLGLRTLRPRKR